MHLFVHRRIPMPGALLALVLLWAAPVALAAAAAPYVRLEGEVGARLQGGAGCSSGDATPVFAAHANLGSDGSYRYSSARVVPYYFDDEGEFNLIYNSDATLFISPYVHAPRDESDIVLATAGSGNWLAAFGRIPEHSELALRVVAYDVRGTSASISRLTWDCTTGQVLSLEHRGNAAAGVEAIRLVEFYNARLDHYFISAAAGEIAALDAGATAGWTRTGLGFTVLAAPAAGASPVCRFYLPPAYGDSHFFSASTEECAAVQASFPAFVRESANAFYIARPDIATGRCPADASPVYRLWNQRADTNHRYTVDPEVKAEMIGRGYVAEGQGPDAVSMCAPR